MMKSGSHRPKRTVQVGGLIQQVLADLLLRKIKDPRLQMVTVTGVEVSPDLKTARVYFSRYGDDEAVRQAAAGLQKAAGYIRRELGIRLQLRYVPELQFLHDTSYAYGDHIDTLLKTLRPDAETEIDP